MPIYRHFEDLNGVQGVASSNLVIPTQSLISAMKWGFFCLPAGRYVLLYLQNIPVVTESRKMDPVGSVYCQQTG